ncbi:hypothetical protein ILYODFUR_003623 [Ilyodon furcidens]|uniref:Uncharacterized protein n=1 Tax=Ilyodon furcidens TaxID=33524 RepID=A0ABV0TJP5_9TELE
MDKIVKAEATRWGCSCQVSPQLPLVSICEPSSFRVIGSVTSFEIPDGNWSPFPQKTHENKLKMTSFKVRSTFHLSVIHLYIQPAVSNAKPRESGFLEDAEVEPLCLPFGFYTSVAGMNTNECDQDTNWSRTGGGNRIRTGSDLMISKRKS